MHAFLDRNVTLHAIRPCARVGEVYPGGSRLGLEFGLSTLKIDGFVGKQRGMKTFENNSFISFICLIIFIIHSAVNSYLPEKVASKG